MAASICLPDRRASTRATTPTCQLARRIWTADLGLLAAAWISGPMSTTGTVYAFVPPVVRVSLTGSDANDGSSWSLAKRTTQAGIDAAATGGEVWVARGIYGERITLRAFAYLYGGFAGIETQRDDRNWQTHATVLDGQQGNPWSGVRARVTEPPGSTDLPS